jgi:hypothetical protein
MCTRGSIILGNASHLLKCRRTTLVRSYLSIFHSSSRSNHWTHLLLMGYFHHLLSDFELHCRHLRDVCIKWSRLSITVAKYPRRVCEYPPQRLAVYSLMISSPQFPLFTEAMYRDLTPPVASSVLAGIAAFLGIAPFVLFFYGTYLRKHSIVLTRLAKAEEEKEERYSAAAKSRRTSTANVTLNGVKSEDEEKVEDKA